MSDESKRDKSPNCPKTSLEDAIKLAKQLYDKVGKAKIKREVAAGALGYSGITGASLTMLGALNQYGLIEQERGTGVCISPLAIKIFHPVSEQEAKMDKITAALTPKVFNVLYTEGFHHCEESVLSNNLIQNGFTPDQAKKVAAVYLANIRFTNLDSESIRGASDARKDEIKAKMEAGMHQLHPVSQEILEAEIPTDAKHPSKKVLAQYSIPIGANEATITFTGEKLSGEDFDALGEYVGIFKKQFERKQKAEAAQNVMSHFVGISATAKESKQETTPSIAKLAGLVK
jgi:DNA-binding transcriptional regulator YhcF (GntR family)